MIHVALITLLLSPWKGPSLPTASASAAKYKLVVFGEQHQSVPLMASGLPRGWVASFCTPRFCSPFRYSVQLDSRGRSTIEFQVIRLDDHAVHRAHVVVSAPGIRPAALDVSV